MAATVLDHFIEQFPDRNSVRKAVRTLQFNQRHDKYNSQLVNTDSRSVEILTPTCQTECFINPRDLFEKSPCKMTEKRKATTKHIPNSQLSEFSSSLPIGSSWYVWYAPSPFQAFEKWTKCCNTRTFQKACIITQFSQNPSDLSSSTKPNNDNHDNRSQSR